MKLWILIIFMTVADFLYILTVVNICFFLSLYPRIKFICRLSFFILITIFLLTEKIPIFFPFFFTSFLNLLFFFLFVKLGKFEYFYFVYFCVLLILVLILLFFYVFI